MAFSSAVTSHSVIGSKRMTTGTFTNEPEDSGGEIDTGLKFVDTFVYSISSGIGSEEVKVTKNSATAGKVTIVTSDGADGDWMAVGL